MHDRTEPLEGGLLEPEARRKHLERHLPADVREGRPVEIEAERVRRTLRGRLEPDKARVAVDVAANQPRARKPIDPRTLARRPQPAVIAAGVEPRNCALNG